VAFTSHSYWFATFAIFWWPNAWRARDKWGSERYGLSRSMGLMGGRLSSLKTRYIRRTHFAPPLTVTPSTTARSRGTGIRRADVGGHSWARVKGVLRGHWQFWNKTGHGIPAAWAWRGFLQNVISQQTCSGCWIKRHLYVQPGRLYLLAFLFSLSFLPFWCCLFAIYPLYFVVRYLPRRHSPCAGRSPFRLLYLPHCSAVDNAHYFWRVPA